MREKPLSQNPGAIKQREWRWKMTSEKRAEYLAARKKRFAEIGVYEQRERRAKLPGYATAKAIAAYHRRPEHYKALQKKYRQKIKEDVFAAYGGTCQCCGEDELSFLTIDHVVPIRKKRDRAGSSFYYKLWKEGLPSGYQVLCFNCNSAKRTNPVCPHKAHYLKLVTAKRPV